jgi:ABC-type sugar transport system substrate-binding protein
MNLLLFCQFTIRNMSIRIQNRFNRLRKRLKMRGEIFMKTKILALLMVIAALISLTACSEKSNNNITDNPSAESNVGSTDEANNTVKDEQKAFKVGFVCPEATNEGWQVTAAAIEDTAKELNIEVSKLYLDPSDYEGSFALAVDTFIQQKVDAIIYGGADESYAATVHKAQEEGIKCVEIDNPTNAGNLWNITVDSYAAAAVAGEWMAKELDAGVVLMINGDMARTNAQQRHDGFVETITNLRSDIEIHEIYANWDSTTALAGVEDAITQYGSRIVGVFSAWDGGALAAVSALEVAGLSDNVIVCGFDGTPTSMTYIREGKLQAEVGQPLYELGKVGMQTVNTVLTGGEAEEKTVVGCSIVTAENVEEFIESAGLERFMN